MKPSERIAEIAQARYDRTLVLWRQSKYRIPSNDTPDPSIQAIDIALYLDEASARNEDNPALDATDGAHPAWWRGHDHAATAVASLLGKIAKTGKLSGESPNAEVRETVSIILELWSQISACQKLAKDRAAELAETRGELARIDKERERLQRLTDEMTESLTARVSRLELRLRSEYGKDNP